MKRGDRVVIAEHTRGTWFYPEERGIVLEDTGKSRVVVRVDAAAHSQDDGIRIVRRGLVTLEPSEECTCDSDGPCVNERHL